MGRNYLVRKNGKFERWTPNPRMQKAGGKDTGQAGGKGRSGHAQVTGYHQPMAAFTRLCFPPEGAGGIEMQEI